MNVVEQHEWIWDDAWDEVVQTLEKLNAKGTMDSINYEEIIDAYFPLHRGKDRYFHRKYYFLDKIFPSKVVVSNGEIRLSVLYRHDKKLEQLFLQIRRAIHRRLGKDKLFVWERKMTRMEIELL